MTAVASLIAVQPTWLHYNDFGTLMDVYLYAPRGCPDCCHGDLQPLGFLESLKKGIRCHVLVSLTQTAFRHLPWVVLLAR
jgi:hypothetical protein